MKKRITHKIIVLLIIGIAIYAILLNVIDQTNIIGGNWTIITQQITEYIPYLIGIVLGFILIIKDNDNNTTTSGRLFLMTGVTGIFFSGLFYELYIDNIWIDELVTASFTITDLQIVTILFFILLGQLVGLIKR